MRRATSPFALLAGLLLVLAPAARADAYECAHPRTPIPFLRAEVTGRGESAAREASLRCEEKTLDSRRAAREAGGRVLLRFDVAEPDAARFAAGLGVEEVPSPLLVAPGAEAPRVFDGRTTANKLVYHLRKHGAPLRPEGE